jgi:Holliday junction DNA helicase RuvA
MILFIASVLRFLIGETIRCVVSDDTMPGIAVAKHGSPGRLRRMIAYLHGKLAEAHPTRVVIDCHGVGYGVSIPLSSFDKLPGPGGEVKLRIYHHVVAQDGAHQLFGFATAEEQEMFELLISISGIGPRLAINILSTSTVGNLRAAIAGGDIKALSSLRGIGKKTAERLVVELRDKVGGDAASPTLIPVNPRDQVKFGDAVSALVSLQYKAADAQKAVRAALDKLGENATVEELVRAALRGM